MSVPGYIRVPEAARRLGIDGPVVYKLIMDGELAAGRRGGFVYVSEAAVETYKAKQRAQ